MQKRLSLGISFKDIKGNFLERSEKYYKHILKFYLYSENNARQRINMLAELRNAFAHVNGRMEMLNHKSRQKIKNWERQKTGITTYSGYLVCDEKIVSDIFKTVSASLKDLMDRYKKWDDIQTNSHHHPIA